VPLIRLPILPTTRMRTQIAVVIVIATAGVIGNNTTTTTTNQNASRPPRRAPPLHQPLPSAMRLSPNTGEATKKRTAGTLPPVPTTPTTIARAARLLLSILRRGRTMATTKPAMATTNSNTNRWWTPMGFRCSFRCPSHRPRSVGIDPARGAMFCTKYHRPQRLPGFDECWFDAIDESRENGASTVVYRTVLYYLYGTVP